MKVVIMAGGKGTRISYVASDIPKPMIKIEGIPVLEREIECLKEQGFNDILITVSHLGNIIMDYFGDGSGNSPVTGQPFGVHIEYYFEQEPLGNAGALFKIKDKLTEDFLLLNADAMFDVDFNRFVEYHKRHGGLVTLFTHPNSHPYDSGLIIADKNGAVEKWLAKEDERPKYYRNRVNGLSNFKALCAVYRSWGSVYYAHNNYVELLVDCGIVGTLIYYSLHIKLLWTGILNWKKMDKEQLMFLGMLLSMIICDYGMVTYFDIFSQLMLVLVYVSFSNLQHIKMQRIRQ